MPQPTDRVRDIRLSNVLSAIESPPKIRKTAAIRRVVALVLMPTCPARRGPAASGLPV